jgi:hypothetical protein
MLDGKSSNHDVSGSTGVELAAELNNVFDRGLAGD